MERQAKSDLRINGLGSSGGGSFNYVQINGKGDINGDLECNELQVNGLGCVRGNVKAKTIRIAGKSEIEGDIEGQEIIVDGLAEIHGKVTAQHLENRGMLRVKGDCGTEEFKSVGGFNVDGLLNSGKLDVEIYAGCSAKEIGGETIDIRRGRGFGIREFIDSIFPGHPWKRSLAVDTIEGDDIFLEDTTAKVVRGSRIKVGTGCRIDSVEYKESFESEHDAYVKENRKI